MASASDIARLSRLKLAQVNEVFEAAYKLLKKGETVSVRNFGSFTKTVHKGRTQNTGLACGEVSYEDRWVLRFKPSKTIKGRLNRIPPGAQPKKKKKKKMKESGDPLHPGKPLPEKKKAKKKAKKKRASS